jgi:hypothetical protein
MNKDEKKDKDDQKSKSEQLEIRTTRFKRCSLGKTVSDRFVFHQSLVFLEGGETAILKPKIQSLTSPAAKALLERDSRLKVQMARSPAASAVDSHKPTYQELRPCFEHPKDVGPHWMR